MMKVKSVEPFTMHVQHKCQSKKSKVQSSSHCMYSTSFKVRKSIVQSSSSLHVQHKFQSKRESPTETENGEIRKKNGDEMEDTLSPSFTPLSSVLSSLSSYHYLCPLIVMAIITKSRTLFIFIHPKIGIIYTLLLSFLLKFVYPPSILH